jgi:hypothetical protein
MHASTSPCDVTVEMYYFFQKKKKCTIAFDTNCLHDLSKILLLCRTISGPWRGNEGPRDAPRAQNSC